ncbi:MAG TPA: hypothetical protein VK981_04245 [Ramlibacter sp.]|nr:hypothetical protein [Ramlibacter sp.]
MTYLNHRTEYNRLVETAKKRSAELRSEAIDDLWTGAGDAALRALRAASRLSHSLARHARVRHGLEG